MSSLKVDSDTLDDLVFRFKVLDLVLIGQEWSHEKEEIVRKDDVAQDDECCEHLETD